MKNKGVILSIFLIICLGVFVTTSTRRFVSGEANTADIYKNQTYAAAKNDTLISAAGQRAAGEEIAADSGQQEMGRTGVAAIPEAADTPQKFSAVPEELSADQAAAAVPEAISDSPQSAMAAPVSLDVPEVSASSKESAVAISPLTGARSSVEYKATVALTAEEYTKKLQEIDSQIKKMKDSGIEPNTDSYKNMAEYEYRLWDNELNSVYQAILNAMGTEEADALRAEERDWIKERDATAHKAISKYNGGTIESLEYTASLADSTRTRVYALVENYSGYLDQPTLKATE